jgi:glycosyltransferase involved in cell wall biosynthesis
MPTEPPVSIVLPVRNEAESLATTLAACLAQDYPGPIEVVVAYAASTDGTRSILAAFEDRDGVRVVDNERGTAPAGLNAAIAAATGDVIVRCDGHATLPPTYVRRAVETLARTGAGNVGGIQRAVGTEPVQRAIARAMSTPLGVGDARFHIGGDDGPVDTVYLGVFDRRALDSVGGFDESLDRNQDYELNVRLRNAGFTVWFDPRLEVSYAPRSSFRGLWRQYHAYGRWKRRVVEMHPDSLRARQAGPPILVVGLVASGLLVATPARRLGMAVLGAYATTLAAVSAYETFRTRDPAAVLTGAAVGVMHVAWGSGFLRGPDPAGLDRAGPV